ncbi:MAG TPA: TrmH family RNA methyltransferase [Croceibacterium sp.]
MMFWAYILRCSDGSYYTGHTEDLENRFAEHQYGPNPGYTRERRPVELAWAQEFPTREEALSAELQVKRWSRAKKEALIAADWATLSYFAIPPGERAQRTGLCGDAVPRLRSGRTDKGQMDSLSQNPIIVLVRPQLGENIGKAARAMLNFGLAELRLVAPRDGWPNPAAGPAASGADEVLAGAQVFDSVAEAVADCAHVYATTVRKRGVTKPVLTPEAAAREIAAQAGRSAILFGPERSGLETDDVALARAIVTVPVNPAFGSLNLAQAVILCAYEWSKHGPEGAAGGLAQPTVEDLLPPAPQDELEGMIAHLERLLEPRDYFFPPSRAVATRRTLRTMLTKPGWNHLEIRTLRGILSTLEKSLK